MRTSKEKVQGTEKEEIRTSELMEDATTYLDVTKESDEPLGEINWDGGERDPEGYYEVLDILSEYETKEYERGLRSMASTLASEGDSSEEDEGYEGDDEVSEEPTVKKSKGKKVFMCLGALVSIILIVGGILFFKSDSKVSISEIQAKTDRLYTNEQKVDIKSRVTLQDVEGLYDKLSGMPEKSKKKDSYVALVKELNTISLFISDKDTLGVYAGKSYDLSESSLLDNLKVIEDNSKGYSVSGLAVTIVGKCQEVRDQYKEYIDIKTELEAVKDPVAFEESNYIDRINNVKHEVNQKELCSLYDSIIADKVKATDTLNKVKIAEEELKKEKDAQIEKLQKEKEAADEELKETKDKLQEAKDSVKNKLNNFLDNEQVEDTESEESEEVTE